MAPDPTPDDRRPPPPVVVVGTDHRGPVDLDTGAAGREETAAAVAAARLAGAVVVRTVQPGPARRAAAVIDAIVAARGEDLA